MFAAGELPDGADPEISFEEKTATALAKEAGVNREWLTRGLGSPMGTPAEAAPDLRAFLAFHLGDNGLIEEIKRHPQAFTLEEMFQANTQSHREPKGKLLPARRRLELARQILKEHKQRAALGDEGDASDVARDIFGTQPKVPKGARKK